MQRHDPQKAKLMYFLLGLHTFIWNIIIIEVKQTWFWLCETWYM